MMSPSVFIIDDDASVRDSIVLMLRKEGMQVRAFASGEDFFDRLPDEAVACVVTDLRMPGMDGVEVVRRLTERRGTAWALIVMTAHADVRIAVNLMQAGVVDLIEKPFDPQRLLEAVKGCLLYLDEARRRLETRALAHEALARLTSRERQVFDDLVEGFSNKEIAQRLKISPRTVEVFRARVMNKTGAENLPALVQLGGYRHVESAAPKTPLPLPASGDPGRCRPGSTGLPPQSAETGSGDPMGLQIEDVVDRRRTRENH